MRTALIALAALALTGCQTFSLEEYAQAANDLDPDCGKDVRLELTPVIMGFWVVPVISGSYAKVCNSDQLAGAPAPRVGLAPGRVVGNP